MERACKILLLKDNTFASCTGTLITSERYWARRASARWRNCLVDAHGKSWKQLYFERNLEDALEQFNVATSNVHILRRLMTYSRRFVHNLKLRQLPSHLDLEILLDCMANSPSALTLCYSLQNVGMEYERALFGMKLCDCRSLARVLERTETLTYLDLSCNMLDDDKARMIASGLVDNLSLTHLDLSHNKIADRGIRAMSKVLDENSVISVLELCDNYIHSEGGRALARSLKKNLSLQSLGMRLNRLGDEGSRWVGYCTPHVVFITPRCAMDLPDCGISALYRRSISFQTGQGFVQSSVAHVCTLAW